MHLLHFYRPVWANFQFKGEQKTEFDFHLHQFRIITSEYYLSRYI